MSLRLVDFAISTVMIRVAGAVVRPDSVSTGTVALVHTATGRILTLVNVSAIEAIPCESGETFAGHSVLTVRSAVAILTALSVFREVGSIGTLGQDGTVLVQPWDSG